MSNRHTLPTLLLVASVGVVACSSGATPPTASPSGSPGAPSPTATPTLPADGIVHPTGANEIVLRYDDIGGFVPPEWLAARVPYFTLYGDGRVVFMQTSALFEPRADGVMVGYPLRTAVLSEEQVQDLLEFALADGGLAIAKTDYQNQMVADASTAVFTINVENDTKTVSVYALGLEGQPGPDTKVLAQLAMLGERLRDFDQGGSLASEAAAYRGVILAQDGIQGVPIREWPWADIAPADFTLPADPNVLQQGTRTLTPAEADALAVDGYENGISGGLFFTGPDDTVYSLVIRPLLPDEQA